MFQDTEVRTSSHKTTQNHYLGIAILNNRVEIVHHTQHQVFKMIPNIILDHNHLIIT